MALGGVKSRSLELIDYLGVASLTPAEEKILVWLLSETFEPANFATHSFIEKKSKSGMPSIYAVARA